MHVRVTVSRQCEEYTDIMVRNVESLDEAVATVRSQLTDSPATRARLLNKQVWMRGEVTSAITIVESAQGE